MVVTAAADGAVTLLPLLWTVAVQTLVAVNERMRMRLLQLREAACC
jgi:hypothetical protein